MTKRKLYAQLAAVVLTVALPPTAATARQDAASPCGTCISITIEPGQTLLLSDRLAGLTILVRVSTGAAAHGPGAEDVTAILRDIEAREGKPGILLSPPVTTALAPADLSYQIRTRATEWRSRVGPAVVLALEASAGIRPLIGDVAPYVDVVVPPSGSSLPAGVRLWPKIAARTAEHALRATRSGGFERWVVDAPADAVDAHLLIAELAAAAGRPREGFFEDVEVRGARRLSVDEIIARHQAMVRRQSGVVARTISSGVLMLTFEAPGFPAPVTITADTLIYADRERTELEQRRIRINGIEFRGGRVPKLPILEPERVASPPLAITLTDLYRYRLDGEERVNGVPSYIVAFEPIDASRTLFRGRAWIAMDSFAMTKVAAAQTALRGAIVSSEQVDEFREVRRGVWLLARSDVRQIYEGAAHRTPIHRLLVLEAHDVDPPDFAERRQRAYASDAVMLRDTPEGYRYLRREVSNPTGSAMVVEVAKAATRVRTLAGGVIIDPNISRPLPFAGISYVDFDLLGTGAQVNAFFGGAYGQLAFSIPSLGRSRWQLAGRAFGIASSYNDRSFRNGREIYEENLRQRPAHASAWLLRPLTPRVSARIGYELDYTRLRRAPETATSFVVPPDQVVHGARFALEGQRAGWTASAWWNPAWRAGWRRWGRNGDYDPAHRAFQRYGLTVAKSLALSPGVVSRVEGAWMDGRDLDRFSRYAFGTFDNRLRGYPSALVRYDRGGVLRGAVAWSATKFIRLDGFLDTAAVEDPGFGRGFRNYTGVGFAAEAPAPFGVLAAVEWGYGFRGVNADGTAGTHVIRVSAFKVF